MSLPLGAHRNTHMAEPSAAFPWRSCHRCKPVPAGADLVVEGFIPPVTEEAAREYFFGGSPATTPIKAPETVVRIQRI